MAHINTYKLKVGFRLYSKHYNLLTGNIDTANANFGIYE